MLHKVIAICLVLFVGCAEEICRRRMELIPGLVWEYYSSNHSRVVSDKYGIIADGMVFITFHDYGFVVSGGDKFAYVDLYRNVLDDSETTHISLSSGSAFRTFDAGYAMGIFAKESHENYLAEMDALKERVEEKLKREGLRYTEWSDPSVNEEDGSDEICEWDD